MSEQFRNNVHKATPEHDLIRVKKGAGENPMRQVFTRTQWDAIGPDKNGWVIDTEVPQAIREMEARKAQDAKRTALYARIGELHDAGFGISTGGQVDENGDGIPDAAVYSSIYGTIRIPVGEIEAIPAEAWPYAKGAFIARLEAIKMLETAMAQREPVGAPAPAAAPAAAPAPAETTAEKPAPEIPAETKEAKEPETPADDAKSDKKAGAKATKTVADESKK